MCWRILRRIDEGRFDVIGQGSKVKGQKKESFLFREIKKDYFNNEKY